jgi:hypothetical protein
MTRDNERSLEMRKLIFAAIRQFSLKLKELESDQL